LVNKFYSCVVLGGLLGALATFLDGTLGDLFRALGVALILTVTRFRALSRRYPLLTQVKASITRRRARFPSPSTPSFSQLTSAVSSATIGVAIGSMIANALNIFLLPPFLLGTLMGGMMMLTSGRDTCEGDLIRCVSMKVFALITLVWNSGTETGVPAIVMRLTKRSLGHLNVFNNKYKVTESVGRLSTRLLSLLRDVTVTKESTDMNQFTKTYVPNDPPSTPRDGNDYYS